jgi:hypothetical protein
MNIPRLVALSLLVAVLPAVARASDKQALKEVKQSSKAQLSILKKGGKAALAALDANLDSFEDGLTATTTATSVANALALPSIVFVDAVDEARETALAITQDAAANALDDLADGGDLQGMYPAKFYDGTKGGVVDKHRAKVDKIVAKLQKKAVKRLGKTVKLAAKRSGVGASFLLRLGTDEAVAAVNQGTAVGVALGPRLDIVVTTSKLDVANDGVLVASGTTDATGDDVDVGYLYSIASSGATVDSPTGGRFSGTFTSLHEGNYAVYAKQGGAAFGTTASIGLR